MRYRLQNAEAKPIEEALRDPDKVVMEPKFDGIRLCAEIGDSVSLFTRTGNSQTGKLPEIEANLFANVPAGTVLDCEAVGFTMVDGKLTQDWGKAQSVLGSGVAKARLNSNDITLVVFDVLELMGKDIRGLPFIERRRLLEALFTNENTNFRGVILSPQLPASEEQHNVLIEAGYEGSMVKSKESRYASGQRGRGWIKLKATDEADVVIMGFKPGENGFAGLIGAVEFGQYKDGVLVNRGRCSGMDMKFRKELTQYQDQYIGEVMSVAYMTVMPSGALRHPQFKRMRFDKPAEECDWNPS